MTKPITLLSLLATLLFYSLPVRAQDATAPTQEEVEQQKEALKNKAYRLLDQIIDESQSLRLPENRVRIQIISADLIWDRDQGRARSLFMQASDGVTELMRSTPSSTNQRGPQPERRWFSLRQELVLAAARHDAPLAYQLLASTKQTSPPATSTADGRNPRAVNLDDNLEQTLLGRIAALDPRLAAQNAEQLMDKGQFPRTMGEVINQLQRQDEEAATKLADKTVKRIQAANLLTNAEAGNLAQSLLNPGPRAAGTTQTDSKTDVTQVRGPVLEQSSYIELLSTVIDNALKATPQQLQNNQRAGARAGAAGPRVVSAAQSNNQSPAVQAEQGNARRLLAGLRSVLPTVDLYLPARANAIRQKLTELGITDSERVNFGQAMGALQQGTATSEAFMQAAASAPGPMQSRLYQQAAVKALEEGNTDRARQIANDFLQAGPRASVMQRIDFREMAKKADGTKLDEIRQSLARLSSDSEKVSVLLQIADDLQKDNPKARLQLLEEAKQIVNHRATNYDHFEDQLRVARAFAAVDPARSFEMLEPGIAQLNELLSAASVLSGFEVSVFRDGEMVMTGQGGSGLNSTINRFGQELAFLAKTDFERSEILAGRFQFTEPRIMTRMSIVQGALGAQSSLAPVPPVFRNVGGGSVVTRP
jgi:hypothetical protein